VGKDVKIGIGVALCLGLLVFIIAVAKSGSNHETPGEGETAEPSAVTAESSEEGWTTLEELELIEPHATVAQEREATIEFTGLPPEAPTAEAGEAAVAEAEPFVSPADTGPLAEEAGPPGVAPAPVIFESEPPAVEVTRTSTPEAQTYTTQKGDTLWDLAARFYGDGRRWKRIYEVNRDVLPSSSMLPIGTVLLIPSAEARIAEALPARLSVEAPLTTGPAGAARATHTVGRGDTLYGIARKQYGDGSLWRVIYEANRGRISAPKRLSVGTVLVIPPTPQRRR